MPCFSPAPDFYVFVMHNLHFLSTPIYIIAMVALIKEKSKLFQTYKYFLIVHLIANFLSEVYVTFMWLPKTYLPYEVYLTTGWLAEMNVSGIAQFEALGQCLNFIGVSILEMFYHRFQAVVLFRSKFYLKLPFIILTLFRILTVIHILVFIWGRLDYRILVYQENKRVDLLKKNPNLPPELGCFTVSIVASEDLNFIITVTIWGLLVVLGLTVIISTVIFINQFLKNAHNLSSQTKKLQAMLVLSLVLQVSIHGIMMALPISVQIYSWIFIIYDNGFGTVMLFFVAYHGFFSTCAMVVFTTQIRRKVIEYSRCCCPARENSVILRNQIAASSTNMSSVNV